MNPVLTFANVAFAPSGAIWTLSGLNLTVGRGEFFVLLAADSGARHAVAVLAAGLERPHGGSILRDAVNPRTGMVFPAPGQGLFAATAAEEVGVGLAWRGLNAREIEARTEFELRRFGLWERRGQSPASLSGGEKQRLAVAAALALDPGLLIMEEPTAMLDPAGAKAVRDAARAAADKGCGLLWLTGSSEIAQYGDRATILHGGKAVWTGNPRELSGLDGTTLASWGLSAPSLARLAAELQRLGLPLSGGAGEPQAVVEEICSHWSGST